VKKLSAVLLFACAHFNASSQWQWAKQAGSSFQFFGEAAKAITDGTDIFLIGEYGGTLYLPNDTLYSNGNNDIFIAKFDANGINLWSKSLGGDYQQGNYFESASGVYDSNCNCIYVAGTFKNTIDFGSGITLTSSSVASDNFIARMELDGTFDWAKKFGGMGMENDPKVYVNDSGKIYLLTQTEDSAYFDTIHIGPGGAIVQYDSLGNCISAEIKFTAPVFNNTNGVFLNFIGTDLVLYGLYRSIPFQLDTATLITKGNYDGFMARADSNGHVKWIKSFGNGGVDYVQSLDIDDSNNIYFTGGFQDSISLGGTTLINSGTDIIVAKFDSAGNFIWDKQMYASGNSNFGNYLTSDGNGNCYVAGSFSDTAQFGTTEISTSNQFDMFLSRFSSSGTCMGVTHFGKADCFNLVIDNSGSVYTAGVFFDSVDIGSTSLGSYLGQDIYLAKHDAISGIEEEEKHSKNQLVIYANPTQGTCNITIPYEFRHGRNLTLSIYDNTGKLIQQGNVEMNEEKVRVNLEAEAKGIYNVTLSNGKKNYMGKIIFE